MADCYRGDRSCNQECEYFRDSLVSRCLDGKGVPIKVGCVKLFAELEKVAVGQALVKLLEGLAEKLPEKSY